MPFGKWKDFDDCVRDFVSKGKDEESAKRICGALKKRLEKESFSWLGDIEPHRKNLIRGKALHPIKTIHPEEWPSVRVYLEEELEQSAKTLVGAPLLLDHMYPLDGRILDAKYEDGAIEYTAELNDKKTLESIGKGEIKHCSVEFVWNRLDKVDGVAPRGIKFTGLSLLKNFEPGDPKSSVEVWEYIIKQLREAKKSGSEQAEPQEFILYQIRDPSAFLEDHFSTVWIDRVNGIQGIYGRLKERPEDPRLSTLLFMKANGWDMELVDNWLRDHPQYVKGGGTEPSEVGIQPNQTPQESIIGLEEKIYKDIGNMSSRIDALEKSLEEILNLASSMKEEARSVGRIGEAVIDPSAEFDSDLISKEEILKELKKACFERVPRHWGFGPYEQNRRIKDLIKRLGDQMES